MKKTNQTSARWTFYMIAHLADDARSATHDFRSAPRSQQLRSEPPITLLALDAIHRLRVN
jgi:hypothetical protein